MTALPYLTATQMREHLSMESAIEAIERTMRGSFDPANDIQRQLIDVTAGTLMLMPSEALGWVGTKVSSYTPDNPVRDLDRIQGVYILMDAKTLTPRCTLDAGALTQLRTAAVSGAAANALASPRASKLVVFGSGPQAKAHIAAMQAIRPIEHVVIVARNGYKSEGLAAWVVERGMEARIGQAMPAHVAVEEADIIVTATTASTPLFDGALVRDDATVLAIGAHWNDNRELDSALISRAQVFVEERETALREAADISIPVAEGALDANDLTGLRELLRGEVALDPARPKVFKSVGMSWEDVAIASEIFAAVPRIPPTYRYGGVGRASRG